MCSRVAYPSGDDPDPDSTLKKNPDPTDKKNTDPDPYFDKKNRKINTYDMIIIVGKKLLKKSPVLDLGVYTRTGS